MSGHSKWSNIKRKKEKTDAQRAKIVTKISREILVCVKEHGCDMSSNLKLAELFAKARANNIPSENVERLIAKASGNMDKNNYEEIIYEGYGAASVAVMVRTLTDNRNRTAGDLRYYFDKFGGNLGQTGCVSFQFAEVGMVVLAGEIDEKELMQDLIELDVEDFEVLDGMAVITTKPSRLSDVKVALNAKYSVIEAGFEQQPLNFVSVEDEVSLGKVRGLLDALDDNDDVQKVWCNLEE
ncbi:MAG: YebC/PmpR family DNA-binding transcriptional regulator [Oscillospiraceae bacterium]|jgi:YebC/PmpR family DNA-binding regulatory protein|nr:YebC/PmpR family DNA-binding transcriptional regulator [Oscillospiraceae bacterium]